MPNYPSSIASKLPRTGTTIFTVMSALAREKGALNLSQGYPEFDAPERLRDLVQQYVMDNRNQYAPMPGVPELRTVVANDLEARHKTHYDADTEVTITAGATQALFTAIMALVREDDEVIIFTPAYDCYAPAVELAGGKPIYVQLKSPDYGIDWDEVRKVVNRKTRMILVNTPHNPTGAVLSAEDLDELEKIVTGNDIIVLSDEVYEHMVFDGQKHLSCASKPDLAACSLIVGSFGKTYHVTGWKVGYIAGPSALMKEFRKVHQYNVFCVNQPMQRALATFMEEHPEHAAGLSDFYEQKRNVFLQALDGSRFEFTPTPGTYFQLLRYRKISKADDTAIAKQWTDTPGVASIPVSVFYHNPVQENVLRFCFAKDDATLKEAAERLKTL